MSNEQIMQKRISSTMKSYVFACTNSTQGECFSRLLFGSNKVYGAVAMRVKKGDFLFLLNLDSDLLYGVFRASTDAQFNIVAEAWGGRSIFFYFLCLFCACVFFILVFRERVSRRVGELENERVWGCRNYRGGLYPYWRGKQPIACWKTAPQFSMQFSIYRGGIDCSKPLISSTRPNTQLAFSRRKIN